MDKKFSTYAYYSNEHNYILYSYIKRLNDCIDNIDIDDVINNSNKNIYLKNWIEDIYYTVLNTERYQKFLTIRCFSSSLINCLPTKDNIVKMPNKLIIKKYNILENIDSKPSCCIV